jgi:hypothetical protein
MAIMKTRIYLLTIGIALLSTSCTDLLDVEPAMSISDDMAISNKSDVLKALNGCYDALQRTGYYGRDFVVIGDLPTDNLDATGTNADYRAIDLFDLKADNPIVLNIWAAIYDAINRGNNVLYRINYIPGYIVEERNGIKAEIRFLRALHYFNLVRLYGDVPYRELPTLNAGEAIHIPRTSKTTIYNSIINDLEYAIDSLPSTTSRIMANKWAAKALMAKIYLTLNNWEQAFNYSNDVIENGGFSLSTVFDYLFTQENNAEVIFRVDFNEQDWTRLAEYYGPTSLKGRKEFWPSSGLVSLLENDSVRLNSSIGPLGQGYKYRDIATGTDKVLVFRLADMLLTRAEARANMPSFDPDLVRADINAVRSRAQIENYTGSNFMTEILLQRRLEFAFEGHRWFDLVRTGTATSVLGINANFTLFPVPQAEILNNNSINESDQNPGY